MTKERFTSLRLVTANYHMPRSLLEFRRAMPALHIVPHPVFPDNFKRDDWWHWRGTFTLVEVECLGACDRAPVVMVNDGWHECLQPEDAAKLMDDLRARGEAVLSGCHHVVERKGTS